MSNIILKPARLDYSYITAKRSSGKEYGSYNNIKNRRVRRQEFPFSYESENTSNQIVLFTQVHRTISWQWNRENNKQLLWYIKDTLPAVQVCAVNIP